MMVIWSVNDFVLSVGIMYMAIKQGITQADILSFSGSNSLFSNKKPWSRRRNSLDNKDRIHGLGTYIKKLTGVGAYVGAKQGHLGNLSNRATTPSTSKFDVSLSNQFYKSKDKNALIMTEVASRYINDKHKRRVR